MSSNSNILCGDEVAAIVADIGSSFCKFGAAGHDSPRHIFPTDVGFNEKDYDSNIPRKYLIGENSLRYVQKNVAIQQPITPENINWTALENILEYGISTCMKINPREYPILISESHFDTIDKKNQLMELFFESFSLPAAYIAKNAMLSGFAAGHPTSLIIDFGGAKTTITPVIDGYTLNKAMMSTQHGGDWLDQLLLQELQLLNYNITPWYYHHPTYQQISTSVSSSYANYHLKYLLRDIKSWLCFIPTEIAPPSLDSTSTTTPTTTPMETNEDTTTTSTTAVSCSSIPNYELPDGNVIIPIPQLCQLPALYFQKYYKDTSNTTTPTTSTTTKNKGDGGGGGGGVTSNHINIEPDKCTLVELIMASLSKCDVDCRRELLGNIVLVGGGSLMTGLPERLTNELTMLLPSSLRVRLNPLLPIERHYATWIGGSILGICGTFQQLWISKEQYEESGVSRFVD